MRRMLGVMIGLLLVVSRIGLAADVPRVMAGYFISWGVYERNYHVTNVPAAYITHINYAFAKPTNYSSSSAALLVGDPWADMDMPYPGDTGPLYGSFNQLIKLKQRYPHIKTLISAGGWTWSDQFSDIAAYSGSRTSFIESCVSFVTNYQFDGIDIDWEYPVEGGNTGTPHRPDDDDNFLLLLQGLRARLDQQTALDGRPYLLTVAISAGYNTLTNRYRLADMCDVLDWLNVMTYDFAGTWDDRTGHNAAIDVNESAYRPGFNCLTTIQTLMSNGVPADKIVLGLPFFGHSFVGVPTNQQGLFQTFTGAGVGTWEPGMLEYNDLVEGIKGHDFIDRQGFVRYWDTNALAAWLYNATGHVFVTYDDDYSITLKSELVRDWNLRGVMYWSMDMDTREWALQKSIYRIFYPVTIQPDPVPALNWFAWTDSVYAVESCVELSSGIWLPCAVVTGHNEMMIWPVTNLPLDEGRSYRWNVQAP